MIFPPNLFWFMISNLHVTSLSKFILKGQHINFRYLLRFVLIYHFEVERSFTVKSDAIEKKWYEYESSNETPRNG